MGRLVDWPTANSGRYSGVAQPAERGPVKPKVGGSSPTRPTSVCPGHAGLLERDDLLFVRLVPKLVPLQRGAVCLVQLRREAIPLIREEVSIAIHGHLDGGVAEVNLDGLGVGALGDQKRSARV